MTIYSKVLKEKAARSKLRAMSLKLELVEENQPAEAICSLQPTKRLVNGLVAQVVRALH